MEKETDMKGEWRSRDQTSQALVVLMRRIPTDMTVIDFEREWDEVRLYCLAIRKSSREGEHCRVTLNQRTSKDSEKVKTSEMCA